MRDIDKAASEIDQGQHTGRILSPIPNSPRPLNWFALYTSSRHEKRVVQHLAQREIECYLPLYKSQRKWADGSRVTLELPLFPGYIFVHIQRSERNAVLSVPGAVSVVGGPGGEPAPLPDSTIDALRAGLELRRVQPHPLVTAGQRVRIRSGALCGFEGIVVRSQEQPACGDDARTHHAELRSGSGSGRSGARDFH